MLTRPRRTLLGALAGAALVLSACGSSGEPNSSAQHATVGSTSVGSLGPVLTESDGTTLYYLSTETRSSIKCTSGCTTTWVPYTVPSGTTPTAAAGVVGTLSTTQRPDGSTQVTFDGHPLYSFVGDTSKGQANGQGADGTWFVLATTGSSTPSSSTTTPSSGY